VSAVSTTRELTAPPHMLGLSLRAALALAPGASALPFVAGAGNEIPDLVLTLAPTSLETKRLADYARVCGFAVRETLPATAPHLLAFPLHMALMTDSSFPFGAVGLVHLSNRIVVRRAIGREEALELRVRATALEPHPKGRTFTIVTEASAGGELVWEEHSTMLRRGGGASGSSERSEPSAPSELVRSAEWELREDLGRRYGSVSGDRNPIHMHALSAKLFGFPRAIAHGMWTKARCLAELEADLPDAYTVAVSFRKPILLPGGVTFAKSSAEGQTCFAVRAAQDETTIHLEGTVTQ
jgi:acyl dehydratase